MKVLRISSLPTHQSLGVGLAAFYLSSDSRLNTTNCSFSVDGSDILRPKSRRLVQCAFANPAMPKQRKGIRFLYLLIRRLWCIFYFSLCSIFRIKLSRFDIVHIHSPFFFFLGFFYKLLGAKLCFTVHGTDFYHLKKSKIWMFLLNHIDGLFCMTQEQLDYFQKFLVAPHIHYVGNGVDTTLFKPDISNRRNQIIAIGRLRWHKGFEYLIREFYLSHAISHGWDLVIIGEGSDEMALKSIIHDLHVEDNVVLKGRQNRYEVASALSVSKIFALSSATEAFPKVLLEAMASGCHVIATDVGEVKNIIGNTEFVIPYGSVGALSNALNKLIAYDIEQPNYDNVKCATAYSWDSYVDNNIMVYNLLLSKL